MAQTNFHEILVGPVVLCTNEPIDPNLFGLSLKDLYIRIPEKETNSEYILNL